MVPNARMLSVVTSVSALMASKERTVTRVSTLEKRQLQLNDDLSNTLFVLPEMCSPRSNVLLCLDHMPSFYIVLSSPFAPNTNDWSGIVA